MAPANGPALRDIHLPADPSWWPPAPGWWGVALLLLAAVVLCVWFWQQRHRRFVLENAMLRDVDVLRAQCGDDIQRLAAGLHRLLRRAALRHDAGAAGRSGEDWRRTLAAMTSDAAVLDRLMSLDAAMYRPGASFDVDPTVAATRRWLSLAWRRQVSRKTSVSTVGDSRHA